MTLLARRRRRLRRFGLPFRLTLIFLALLLVGWLSIRPTHDREWKREHAILPEVEFEDRRVVVRDVRNFEWTSDSGFRRRYEDRTYDLDALDSLWLGLAVFDPDDFRGPAHSLLSFGFSDGRYVAISVEARKEVGERYSIWKGMVKRYELIYVIGDEADLIGSRVRFRPDQVFLYPIRAERRGIRALFVDMLEAAELLRQRPEFYNTLTNNCTTRLRDHVERVAPGRIPPSWKILLPGYLDELLASLDLLPGGADVEEIRERYDVSERGARAFGHEDFSRRIREAPGAEDEPRPPAEGED